MADQVIAAVVAGLVPLIVKLITDWNRVALTRAGHGDIASDAGHGSATTAPPSPPQSQSRTTPETPPTPPPATGRPPSHE